MGYLEIFVDLLMLQVVYRVMKVLVHHQFLELVHQHQQVY